MKHRRLAQNQAPTAASASPPNPAARLTPGAAAFVPSPDEVSRRAYFSYLNHGSLPGHDVQHWLEAEAHLLAERNLTRTHGAHNPT